MSADDGSRRYFLTIEEAFIRLRGSPLLLSPEDWRQAEDWYRRGVPLDLVLRILERVFERRAERGATGKIQSLRYCAPAVEAAWEEIEALTAGGRRRRAEPLDVGPRLEALAAALPGTLAGRDSLAGRILDLTGTTAEVEAGLAALDEEMMAAVEGGLEEDERRQLAERVRKAAAALADRLEPDERADAHDRLVRQALRRERSLPVLSLFSPEAMP